VKRILMVLTVALIAVAMVVATAAPAFAAGPCCGSSHHIITGTGDKFKPGHH
jgi:hypothetical protein